MSDEKSRINHPHHYTQGEIECIQAIEAALGKEGVLAYCRGAAMKYLWRCMYKKSPKKDLQKAAWYCERAQMYVGETPTSTNKRNFLEAVAAERKHWIDTSNRVRPISNPPEGEE